MIHYATHFTSIDKLTSESQSQWITNGVQSDDARGIESSDESSEFNEVYVPTVNNRDSKSKSYVVPHHEAKD